MLEERVKSEATADLEYVLACFEVDRWGVVKKIKDTLMMKLLPSLTLLMII